MFFPSPFRANLSEEYFKTRQDRAWLFKGVPDLANFYQDLIEVVSSLSYQVTPTGELKPTSQDADSVLGKQSKKTIIK